MFKGSREERRLMRQRGAGTRELPTAQFGFVLGTKAPSEPPADPVETQDPPNPTKRRARKAPAETANRDTTFSRKRLKLEPLSTSSHENEPSRIQQHRKTRRTSTDTYDTSERGTRKGGTHAKTTRLPPKHQDLEQSQHQTLGQYHERHLLKNAGELVVPERPLVKVSDQTNDSRNYANEQPNNNEDSQCDPRPRGHRKSSSKKQAKQHVKATSRAPAQRQPREEDDQVQEPNDQPSLDRRAVQNLAKTTIAAEKDDSWEIMRREDPVKPKRRGRPPKTANLGSAPTERSRSAIRDTDTKNYCTGVIEPNESQIFKEVHSEPCLPNKAVAAPGNKPMRRGRPPKSASDKLRGSETRPHATRTKKGKQSRQAINREHHDVVVEKPRAGSKRDRIDYAETIVSKTDHQGRNANQEELSKSTKNGIWEEDNTTDFDDDKTSVKQTKDVRWRDTDNTPTKGQQSTSDESQTAVQTSPKETSDTSRPALMPRSTNLTSPGQAKAKAQKKAGRKISNHRKGAIKVIEESYLPQLPEPKIPSSLVMDKDPRLKFRL